MTRSKEFVRDLQSRLTESPANRRYDWKHGREWKPAKGERQSVDLGGTPVGSGPVLLVEVELRRGDPSSNVLKIWRWKSEKKLSKDFVLFQAFSRYYKRKNETLVKRAKFLGVRMQNDPEGARAEYVPIRFAYRPGKDAKAGGGARRHRARYLAGRILREMRKRSLV